MNPSITLNQIKNNSLLPGPESHSGTDNFILLQINLQEKTDRLPARNYTTRMELYRRVLVAQEFMLSQWETPLKLEKIAQCACLSIFHFHRCFREIVGLPPMKWFKKKKMEKAKELLAAGQCSVTEVAYRSGFADLAGFSKAFKREWGCNPSEVGLR